MSDTDHQYKPTPDSDRTHWSIQGIVERPDGSLIRPASPVKPEEMLSPKPDDILRLLLKGYDCISESRLLKAWLVSTTVKTASSAREVKLTQP
jgi:hypothetical protein